MKAWLCALLLVSSVPMQLPAAESVPAYHTQALLTDQALGNASGVISLNMAAGDNNMQLNGRALAITLDRGIASSKVSARQQASNNHSTPPDVAISRIDSNVFNNARGIIGVNQASGVDNMQMNGVAIGLGLMGAAVAESALEATRSGSSTSPSAPQPGQRREAEISGDAFDGARGIIQVNQLAGSNNTTSNHFALSVSLDGPQ